MSDFKPDGRTPLVRHLTVLRSEAGGPIPYQGNRLRIMVVDDQEVVRRGLIQLISVEPDLEVVGETSDGRQAVELVRKLRPDVVIMDVRMREMDGVEATQAIHAESPDLQVIGLSMSEEPEQRELMRKAGAVDYVSKQGPAQTLLAAIRARGRSDT